MPSSAIKAIFTKTFVAISLINMLGLAGYYAIFVVSTQFLSEVFHASTAVAGLATGIIVIGCLVGRFFTGSIVHSAGYRRVLFCGVVLYLLTNAAYFFADTLALIFLVRFVSGVAVGHRRHSHRHDRGGCCSVPVSWPRNCVFLHEHGFGTVLRSVLRHRSC